MSEDFEKKVRESIAKKTIKLNEEVIKMMKESKVSCVTISTAGYYTELEQAVIDRDYKVMANLLDVNICPYCKISLTRTKGGILAKLGLIGGELRCSKCGFTVSGK